MRWSTKFCNILERIKFGIRGATLPTGVLPYEIWLAIVDAVINDLESTVKPLSWVVVGFESEQVTDMIRCRMLDKGKHPWSHRIEHFLIDEARNWERGRTRLRHNAMEFLRNFTLVDHRTREIINRRLPRCTYFRIDWHDRGRPLTWPSSIRVVPSVDQFAYCVKYPIPHDHMVKCRTLFRLFEYGGCVGPFSHVQSISLCAVLLRPGLVQKLRHHFQYLQKMPNLENVEFRAKGRYMESDKTATYTVEDNLITFLPENLDMVDIVSLWRSLKDRGVRFTVSHSKPLIEFT
ncbi:hypothetical protein BDP55DRAFT_333707 [Colletotrichum godetiae]|uniref:Uncharacterized protein n=1 Tax=Colletotrichum godetiae TaxID=1209918 RepID=A0AAJ0AAS3_9PEZI|nr:uncharacterized protein BDP55DRAFT_333707 [Colletotrichum godetiae]KAK1659691.1 hypothetical protein BDP55DRAFT_333707 [Colletotrichum godetiae]